MSWVSVCAVIMMIGTMLSARSARHTSKPDMPGKRRSSSTRSGGDRSELVETVLTVGCLADLVALVLERHRQRQADSVVVFDEQQ